MANLQGQSSAIHYTTSMVIAALLVAIAAVIGPESMETFYGRLFDNLQGYLITQIKGIN